MKKLCAVLLAAAMTVSAMGVSAFAEETVNRDVLLPDSERTSLGTYPVYSLGKDVSEYDIGDVNMDGKIDTKDSNAILCEFCFYEILEMGHVLDEEQIKLADVWKSEPFVVDSKDANVILNYEACKIAGVEEAEGLSVPEFVAQWNRFVK